MSKALLLILIPLLLASCSGYQLGGSKPTHLSQVKSIHVPLFENDTLFVRAESHATNCAVNALTRDGTYRISNAENADAILRGRVAGIKYAQVSTSRRDSLSSEEISLEVTIAWTLEDARNPARILEKGRSKGRTEFFARNNLNIARTNALPDALRAACESMTSRLADGF